MMSLTFRNTVSETCESARRYRDMADSTFYTVNPASVDLDAEDISNVSQVSQPQTQDPLYQYLDPSLAGTSNGTHDGGLGGTAIPLSSTNPLASIPQTHQLASSAPQDVPASSLDLEQTVKEEPAPSPVPFSQVGSTNGKGLPSKASKMPAKTPARSSKRRLSTTMNQSVDPVSDTQRRSTRQKNR